MEALESANDRTGLYQLIISGVGLNGRYQRTSAMASVEASYIYLFLAIHELFGFAQRLKAIQQKIKFYAGCIRERRAGD